MSSEYFIGCMCCIVYTQSYSYTTFGLVVNEYISVHLVSCLGDIQSDERHYKCNVPGFTSRYIHLPFFFVFNLLNLSNTIIHCKQE